MGADGHIAYYDSEKVDQIRYEVIEKYPKYKDDIYFNGYRCNYLVNGKKVCLSYWGDNADWVGWGREACQYSSWQEANEGQKEFAKRIAEEAFILEQEVWT